MTLLKSQTSSSRTDFLGFFEAGIVDVTDRSDEFEWADAFLDVTFHLKGSQFPQIHSIKGSFDKGPDGSLEINRVVRHLNYFFDAIAFTGGLNTVGTWENADGTLIPNIADTLNDHIAHINGSANPLIDPPFNHYIYLYKEPPKEPNGKSYKRVLAKITSNDDAGHKELSSYVDFMKSKGYLKEAGDAPMSSNEQKGPIDKF